MNPFHSLVGIRGAEVIKDESKKVLTERHQLYNVLGEEPTLEDSNFQGHYTLRIDGQEVCGLEVLGLQPWKVVLGSPWACDQHASSLAVLADELRRRFRRWGCSLVYDTKDARAIKFLDGDASQHFGLMRRKQPMRIAVTGIPMGLSEEQQTRLARAPFLIPWEALPFHSGRLVFPVALRFLSPLFGSNPSESGGARG
eukprot:symbB.v1.2.020647.t1/scaffold1750.1/size103142/7